MYRQQKSGNWLNFIGTTDWYIKKLYRQQLDYKVVNRQSLLFL
uniref:Uncharacterized protein n=1 Tax=Anguilla anguilla TaxID=7936 RepID=A0A0E9WSS5_ANGAN